MDERTMDVTRSLSELRDFERLYFSEMMRLSNFDMAVAERKTGLSMQSLYRLLKKNGLRMKDLKSGEGL